MIADQLKGLLRPAIEGLVDGSAGPLPEIELERPARAEHGDYSTNLPLILAGRLKRPPRQVAEDLIAKLPPSDLLVKAEVAGPGFINFFLTDRWLQETVAEIASEQESYGRSRLGAGVRVLIEFVSANPTGPLHVGSGRNAAYGDAVARVLEVAGYEVVREYYINDAGKQMERFAASLHARYLQALGRDAKVPEDGYQGEYLAELGGQLAKEYGVELVDQLDVIRQLGTARIAEGHRKTLERFRVEFDNWVSESALHESGKVAEGIQRLKDLGHTYEKDGAVWFRSSELGASRDQVIVRSDEAGTVTYLGSDVGYLLDKTERGFDELIYVWGADHHGNVAGLEAVARALGVEQAVEIKLHQLVNFVAPTGEATRMSRRAGTIVTLDELIDEVGVDAARFTLVSRTVDATIDFDLALVKSESQENPVYYVQYQHARACSILRNAEGAGVELRPVEKTDLGRLTHDSEVALIRGLSEYPELVEEAARLRAPHRLSHYVQSLAALFSAFYRDCRVLSEDDELTQARLRLVDSTRQVIANALDLLGVSAPESM
ncbi:MAG: arginine--tRNA ligase [Actinomycetota bacterium]|nr:arginine--tRNA ligase [Actinomycetota bacterium]